MKQYEKYKDSGIEWIGETPEHWDVRKLKGVSRIETGNTPPKSDEENYEGEYLWVKPDELLELIPIMDTKEKLTEKGKELSRVIPKGSILVCGIGSIGKMGVAGLDLSTNQQINAIIPDNNLLNDEFAKFLFLSSLQQEEERVSSKVVVPILNKTKLGLVKVPIPKREEQIIISDYLDNATEKINKVIENRKKQIELLKEKENVVVKDLITKGISNKSNFKDSGYAWIESVPSEWKLRKIQNTTYVKGRIGWQGLTSEEYLEEGEYLLVTGTDFDDRKINWETCHFVEKERYDEDPYIQLQEEDVLITKDGTIGKIAFVENLPMKATLNSGVFVTRPLNSYYKPKYLFWVLSSNLFGSYIEYIKTGSTIAHLYQNKFVRFYFPIPSLDEQKQIIAYLDEKTSKIQKSISIVEDEISKLEEYKKILINDVVTGKMKVTA